MNAEIENFVLKATQAQAISHTETLQTLWSGYGAILRLHLTEAPFPTVILKKIVLPEKQTHPRGWNTDLSHQRKVKSYEVETHWYQNWSTHCGAQCRIPQCYAATQTTDQQLILLEDLDTAGFHLRKSTLAQDELVPCLHWLANFHATFIHEAPTGLWPTGTYWHLETRPDELAVMTDLRLKKAAPQIDSLLSNSHYSTFVHGDAKVANFCFSSQNTTVAAVDFQYVGGGCGMKDLAYFLGSCLSEDLCEQWESTLLDSYFAELCRAIDSQSKKVDFTALEKEWRTLFPVAWADFHRFLLGWMPTHYKVNNYSRRITREVLDSLGL